MPTYTAHKSLFRHQPGIQIQAGFLLLIWLFFAMIWSSLSHANEPQIPIEENLPQIRWNDTERFVGQRALVSGRIVRVGHARRIHFLNFHKRRRDVFKVIIFEEHIKHFPASLKNLYDGKLVEVQGTISRFKDHTQIRVTSPDQIRVLSELPKTHIPEAVTFELGHHLRIATFNVLNLFDSEDDPYHEDETTKTKPRADLQRLSHAIRDLNADVLALQEVENRDYLQRFLDVFLRDLGYRHVVHFEGNDGRGIDVCLVSRVPVGRVTSHRHLRFSDAKGKIRRFQRDLLSVRLLPPATDPFEVWVVHLKSKGGPADQADIRLAEASQVRDLLNERFASNPQARIIVCGDFNDTFDSPPVTTIVNSPNGSLVTFFDDIPEGERITYNRQPYRDMIDFILCSPQMAKDYIPNSFQIHHGSPDVTGSDHNPVVAAFRHSH